MGLFAEDKKQRTCVSAVGDLLDSPQQCLDWGTWGRGGSTGWDAFRAQTLPSWADSARPPASGHSEWTSGPRGGTLQHNNSSDVVTDVVTDVVNDVVTDVVTDALVWFDVVTDVVMFNAVFVNHLLKLNFIWDLNDTLIEFLRKKVNT